MPNEYAVVLRKGITDVRGEAARATAAGAVVTAIWEHALKGFAISASPQALAALRRNSDIDYVQPNTMMHISTSQTCAPYLLCSWGLDRIDESNLPMDGSYFEAPQAPNQGASVHAYSIDTGIRISHAEFGGRAAYGFDFIHNTATPDDDHGHGTHTSGTIGGATYGVAKRVQLVAVKVCNRFGNCPTNAIISGVNWVTANAIKPAVANMSLGGSVNAAIDQAVATSIASGVTYGIAAGNNAGDACQTSPARVPSAITVGATGSSDGFVPPRAPDDRASYSNFGSCVDVFAPGSQILSSWNTSNNATNIISGTSMATPHVVGAAALYLDAFPTKSPAQVAAALVANATSGVVGSPGAGSPNKLLNTSRPARP